MYVFSLSFFPITHKHCTILLTRLEPPQVLASMERTSNQSLRILRTTVHSSVISIHNLRAPCFWSFLSFSFLPTPSISSPHPYPTNFKFFLQKNPEPNTTNPTQPRKNKTTPKKLNKTLTYNNQIKAQKM